MTLPNHRRGRGVLALLLATAVLAPAMLHGGWAAGAATASAARTTHVDINHFAFHPGTLEVKRGAKVAFTNSSGITHTATGAAFDTGHIRAGTTSVIRFNQRGTFRYHCQIHPFMKGKIVVR